MDLVAKIFFRDREEYVFGPGRCDLLAAVEELGSLRKAAQKLGMSYRWAWGRLKKAETELGVALLLRTEKSVGGRPKVLTNEGRELLRWYREVEESVRRALAESDSGRPEFLRSLPEAASKKSRPALD